jgi:hypothetical protein
MLLKQFAESAVINMSAREAGRDSHLELNICRAAF